ncbi:hypothetical protein [Proteiniclasticum ruminis]|uniref:Uncharacterized protein n=1 Tax=Proteiniclasticum ruminis TaxID=398199 RepID=A0A1I5ATJ5_9CLOT|nr:hypothetical protein [Proteiniclasticum ruminis]SFN65778.1 hypothetical protein SAMN04488695_103181 [Proteiniclasticum ruminis]
MDKINVIVHEKALLGITERDYELHKTKLSSEGLEGISILVLKKSDKALPPFVLGAPQNFKDVYFSPFTVLEDPLKLWDLKRRLLAYQWMKSVPLPHRQSLFESWYILKFLCQELKNVDARQLGRDIAALQSDAGVETLERYRLKILSLLQYPSTPEKIRGSLWKNYTNQLKKTQHPLPEINDPKDGVFEETLVHELHLLEEEAIKKHIFFGTSPVLYEKKSS